MNEQGEPSSTDGPGRGPGGTVPPPRAARHPMQPAPPPRPAQPGQPMQPGQPGQPGQAGQAGQAGRDGGHDSPYHAAVAAAWRSAAERGLPALALVPPTATGPSGEDTEPGSHLVRWANHALLELLGLDHREVVGRPLADLPSGSTTSWANVTRTLVRGTSTDVDAVVHRPDGTRHQVSVDLCRLGQGVDGWLVTLHPVTDEEQSARTALREAEHRFRALADHAPTGIFVSEAGLRLGYVNERFAELLGTDPHHLLGTRWLEAIHPDDRPQLYDNLQWVLGGEARDVTLRLTPTGDVQRWIFLRLAPTTTPARAAGFIGAADDITSRRAWEERLSYQARHDTLTGLLNQVRFAELLREALGSKRDRDRELAVALIDLDGFAAVNDTHGRETGDRVLVEMASRLRRTGRERDLIARSGGAEFLLLLEGVRDTRQAETAVRRHLERIAEPLRVTSGELLLSATAGVALAGPRDTPDGLLRAARSLLQLARRDGPGSARVGHDGADGADGPDGADGGRRRT